jgi:hypothetical protein
MMEPVRNQEEKPTVTQMRKSSEHILYGPHAHFLKSRSRAVKRGLPPLMRGLPLLLLPFLLLLRAASETATLIDYPTVISQSALCTGSWRPVPEVVSGCTGANEVAGGCFSKTFNVSAGRNMKHYTGQRPTDSVSERLVRWFLPVIHCD